MHLSANPVQCLIQLGLRGIQVAGGTRIELDVIGGSDLDSRLMSIAHAAAAAGELCNVVVSLFLPAVRVHDVQLEVIASLKKLRELIGFHAVSEAVALRPKHVVEVVVAVEEAPNELRHLELLVEIAFNAKAARHVELLGTKRSDFFVTVIDREHVDTDPGILRIKRNDE